jgi:hypothetical protein
MNLADLGKPFKEEEIEWRLAQCGKAKTGQIWGQCLAYITARAIMDRLDLVCGPENWKVRYDILPTGVLCHLSIRVVDQWIEKTDGAEQTEIEAFKGGISSALKRAGSVWNMGRYLYGLESGFVEIVDKKTKGAKYGKTKEGEVFYWLPPLLPDWALPTILPGGIVPEFVRSGQQKEGEHFKSPQGAPALAMKHPEDVATEDLKKFVTAMDEKYKGKSMPEKTLEAHKMAMDQILKREGALDEQVNDDPESFQSFGVVKR